MNELLLLPLPKEDSYVLPLSVSQTVCLSVCPLYYLKQLCTDFEEFLQEKSVAQAIVD